MEKKQYTILDIDFDTNYKKIDDSHLTVVEVDQATVLPFTYLDKGAIRRAGGVLNSKKEFVEESGSRDGYLKYGKAYSHTQKTIEYADEEVIWFGYYYSHWGHFLIELVGRMWYVLNHYKGQKIIYISQDGDLFKSVFLEFMGYLGIPDKNIIKIDRPTGFSKIIIPSYCATEYYYSEKYINLINRVIKNSDYQSSDFQKYEDIYLSRKKVKDSKIKDFGEKEVEKIFLKNGFVSVSPETLSLKDQIFIWNKSRTIACVNGTLPLNIVFNREKINLIVLNKTNILHEALISIHKVFNASEITYIDVFFNHYKGLAKNIGVGPFFIHASEKLRDFLTDRTYDNQRLPLFDDVRMKMYYIKYKIYKIYGDYYYVIPKYYYRLKKRFSSR